MAAKKRAKPGEKDYGKVNFRGFVNVYLKPQEKQQIKDNLLTDGQAMEFVAKLVGSGYKFSLSLSNDGKTHTATAYCTDFKMANAGYGLSMRHSDYLVAVTALQWCFVLEGYDANWEEIWGTTSDDDW